MTESSYQGSAVLDYVLLLPMLHRSWKSYQNALADFNATKSQHDAAVSQWQKSIADFDESSPQAGKVGSIGCLGILIAAGIAYSFGTASTQWGWLIVWFVIFGIYHTLDEKCRGYAKRRFLEANPQPQFTQEEPTYEPPPGEHSPPPHERQSRPQRHDPPPPRTSAAMTYESALAIFGLTRQSTMEDLKRAYRERIRQYHPDKVAHLGPELRVLAEHKAKEANAAYEYVTKVFQARSGD